MYARHQAALAALTQAALANSSLPTLLQLAASLAARTLAVAYSSIWELAPGHGTLVLRAGIGWPDATPEVPPELAATSLVGTAVLGASPALVADWPSETRFLPPPQLRGSGVISSLAVAIPGQDQPFGGIGVDVTASRRFGDEEIDFLKAVANVLALVVERTQATQAIEQRLIGAAQNAAVLEERQRLARDLHDSVTQALYSVTLHAQGARRLLAVGQVAMAADALRSLQDTAQEALDEMRLLIFDLRPPILEQVGLVAALQARLNAVEGRANLQTRLIADEFANLPSLAEQALYRIAQEALNNALKHARAQHITVQLRRVRSRVMLEVADDGVGFEPSAAGKSGGVGLRGIVERVAQLQGSFSIQSAPGAGTQLRVEIDL